MYLSVSDRLTLDLLAEVKQRGGGPLSAASIKVAVKGLLGGGYVNRTLTRLVGLGAVVKTTRQGVRYAATAAAVALLNESAGMVDSDIYIYVVAAHAPDNLYVAREEIAEVFSDASGADLDAALTRLQDEKLLTKASFTEARYFPTFCDDQREERLVVMLNHLGGYFEANPAWALELLGLPTLAPSGPRGRLSPLAV